MAKMYVLWKIIGIVLAVIAACAIIWFVSRAIYINKKNKKIDSDNAMMFRLKVEKELAQKNIPVLEKDEETEKFEIKYDIEKQDVEDPKEMAAKILSIRGDDTGLEEDVSNFSLKDFFEA